MKKILNEYQGGYGPSREILDDDNNIIIQAFIDGTWQTLLFYPKEFQDKLFSL